MTASSSPSLVKLAIKRGALEHINGYTLKSGRKSPYFLNCGKLVDADAARRVGELYADKIKKLDLRAPLVLLGLPYKGIPLAALAAVALGEGSFAYLRAEPKDHGEGGLLVGHVEQGADVVLIDDVLTAGTATRKALAQLSKLGIKPAALVVAFDRMERVSDNDNRAASEVIAKEYDLKFSAIATASDLLDEIKDAGFRKRLEKYQSEYGAVA